MARAAITIPNHSRQHARNISQRALNKSTNIHGYFGVFRSRLNWKIVQRKRAGQKSAGDDVGTGTLQLSIRHSTPAN